MNQTLSTTNQRIWSVDMLRGFVIALMAIDHIRDFWALTPFAPEDLTQTSMGWFFTRWITHFCAPVFVFLAGTSAFLFGQQVNDKGQLAKFLLSRGIWLLFIEITVINLSWTFSWYTTTGMVFFQVIWVIGISMISLAGLIYLPEKWIAMIGLLLVAGHNALDGITPDSFGGLGWFWNLLHMGFSFIPLNRDPAFGIFVVYPLIPWIGVMALGYVFGNVMLWEKIRRQTFIIKLGLVLITMFIILRFVNIYGDPNPWNIQERGAVFTLLSFLNTTKYPPSLLFLMMTMGPGLLLLVPFENLKGKGMEILKVFGKVPFFFYVSHFLIIHLGSRVFYYITLGENINFFRLMAMGEDFPNGYLPRLWLVYVVWGVLMVFLYFLCKWYGNYKATHGYWWLKYL